MVLWLRARFITIGSVTMIIDSPQNQSAAEPRRSMPPLSIKNMLIRYASPEIMIAKQFHRRYTKLETIFLASEKHVLPTRGTGSIARVSSMEIWQYVFNAGHVL